MESLELKMPSGWKCRTESYPGPFGGKEFHAEAVMEAGQAEIDVSVGAMPEDSSAPDQALTNYVDMVGFDETDAEDYNPIEIWEFNNRKAYGFQVWTEEDHPLRVMCIEMKKDALAVITVEAKSDEMLENAVSSLQRGLRLR